jgi:F-type H+-transporting ATPase subunit a
MSNNPLSQFEIKPIVPLNIAGYDISFTNSSLFMTLTFMVIVGFFVVATRSRQLIPGRLQSAAELTYNFIADTVKDNVGTGGLKYVPFVFTLFAFVIVCNLLGMLPYSFTVTSHIIVTFALALLIFISVTLIGFLKHGLHFLSFFLPAGTPWWLAPLIIVIELFTYLSRPISLSLRLTINMVAGHALLKVLAGFVVALGFLWGWTPIPVIVVLTAFELFVAILQAYIFTVLTCIYLNDAVNLH